MSKENYSTENIDLHRPYVDDDRAGLVPPGKPMYRRERT